MAIRAKVRCGSVFPYYGDIANGIQVSLYAVYSTDPSDPNFSYSTATPQAMFQMVITNPDAAEAFIAQKDYLVTFEEA